MSILDGLRILGGGALWLIVISLTLLLWRIGYLLRHHRVNGMVRMLFHITLAAGNYFLWAATGAFLGLWLGQIQAYITFRIIWWFVVVMWLLAAIIYAAVCITKELYRDMQNDEQ